jgi:hypothetical protein
MQVRAKNNQEILEYCILENQLPRQNHTILDSSKLDLILFSMPFFLHSLQLIKSAMKMLTDNNPATCLVTKKIKCNEYLQDDQES